MEIAVFFHFAQFLSLRRCLTGQFSTSWIMNYTRGLSSNITVLLLKNGDSSEMTERLELGAPHRLSDIGNIYVVS